MESEIQAFYKNKTVFITGGSGFLGKVIVEKLLRSTDVGRIFMMIRPKKGKKIEERLETWPRDPEFQLLLSEKPEALQRIQPITGDCLETGLGLSSADRQLLIDEVQVVLHSAATVRFNEPLHQALAINTGATHFLLELAKEMRKLEAFVHVSTAFSNSVGKTTEETYYPEPLTCTPAQALALRNELSPDVLEKLSPTILDKYPNTYIFTKSLAEQLVREQSELPVCIVRPGIIIASHNEPKEGWVDNVYGPIGIILGVAMGVLRVFRVNKDANANILPVDYCGNICLASAWQTAEIAKSRPKGTPNVGAPLIYNFVPSPTNMLTWNDFKHYINDSKDDLPLTKAMWYPFVLFIKWELLYKFVCFFYHIIPGFVIDTILRVRGKKPRMLSIYSKIHVNNLLLSPFIMSNIYFGLQNTNRLWQRLSPDDKNLFRFDMSSINWDDYFPKALTGMRIFLCNEKTDRASFMKANRRYNRLKFVHYLLSFLLCIGLIKLLLMFK